MLSREYMYLDSYQYIYIYKYMLCYAKQNTLSRDALSRDAM